MGRLVWIVWIWIALTASDAFAAKRAFLAGLDDYESVRKLDNAAADARKMAEAFRNLGYQTTLILNAQATRTKLLTAFHSFVSSVNEGDDVVVFYAGHGVEVLGTNYLVPIDAPPPNDIGGPDALPQILIPFSSLIEMLKAKRASANIWIIDACRNNPFSENNGRDLGGVRGLANIWNPAGTFIFYSAGAGQTALDRLRNDPPTEKNSPYTREFVKLLQQRPSEQVTNIAKRIRLIVRDLAAPHPQRPAFYDELDVPWCFSNCTADPITLLLQTPTQTLIEPTPAEISTAIVQESSWGRTVPANAVVPPNAIFLGKKSSAQDCEKRNLDVRPFGCDMLISLVGSKDKEKDRAAFIGRPLAPLTDVNIRKRPPTVEEKKGAVYACVVRTLSPPETVSLSGVLDISYAGDTFYWGTLDESPQDCRSLAKALTPVNVCAGNGGGRSCLGPGVIGYTCNEFRAIGGGADATYTALNRRICGTEDASAARVNVRHNFSREGGQCGWTSFTVTCIQ